MSIGVICPEPEHLRRILAENSLGGESTDLLAHIESCESCQQALEHLAAGKLGWQARAKQLKLRQALPESSLQRAIEDLKLGNGEGEPAAVSTLPDDVRLDFLDPPQNPGTLGRLGHYDVLGTIGRGGCGVVLKAIDPSLKRFVAIKVLAPQLATSAAARKRFDREARAAAAVSHEHVVAVHGVDEVRGLPYIVMAYVPGRSLQERIDQAGPLELVPILRIGMQTAAGLAAAHAQGLIHRDVKPANILLEDDVDRVKITDFGLARAADDASLTQSGMVAGTPEFMSPEQAGGHSVDHRSDLFSLGSVLYSMCTGRPPFRADSAMAVLRRVCDDTPHPLNELNSAIPDWLAAIIAKLHAKQPAGRFQTAAEVSDLLGQCLAHIQQPRTAPLPRTAKELAREQARRRPSPALRRRLTLAAASILFLLGGLGLTEATGVTNLSKFMGQIVRVVTPRGTLVIETDDPAIHITVDGENVTIDGTGLGQLTLRPGSHQVQATKDGSLIHNEPVTISRGDRQVVKVTLEPVTKRTGQNPPDLPSPKPDSEAGDHKTAGILFGIHAPGTGFSTDSTQPQFHRLPIFPLSTYEGYGSLVAFTPDSRMLVACSEKQLRTVVVNSGKVSVTIEGPNDLGRFKMIAISPDGKWIATAGDRGGIWFWEANTGEPGSKIDAADGVVHSLDFSPDSKLFAVAGRDPVVRILDMVGGLHGTLNHEAGQVFAVRFSPDGSRIATSGNDGTVRMWEATSGKLLWSDSREEGRAEYALSFSPDGKLLATGGRVQSLRLLAVETGKVVRTFAGHEGNTLCLEFLTTNTSVELGPATTKKSLTPREDDGSGGLVLASGGSDGKVRLWDVGTGKQLAELTGAGTIVRSLAISRDGRSLAAASHDNRVVLYGRAESAPDKGPIQFAQPFFKFMDFGGVLRRRPEILTPVDCRAWADRGRMAFYATDENGNIIQRQENGKYVAEEIIRDQRWVVITALFPHADQRSQFGKALHTAEDQPQYARVRVERRNRREDGSYSDWATVDYVKLVHTYRLLMNRWQPEKSDLRNANAVFPGLVMRLPRLVEGEWLHADRDEALDAARRALEVGRTRAPAGLGAPTAEESMKNALQTLFPGPLQASGTQRGMSGLSAGQGMQRGIGGMGSTGMTPPPKAIQVSAAEKLLVRFSDFTVEHDQTYQYRLKVVVNSPNFKRMDVVSDQDAREEELESAEWSEPTPDVRVPLDSTPSAALNAKAQFFGIEAIGNKIIYVIDRSGSMSQHGAMAAVGRNLSGSLMDLPGESQFQVIFYNLFPVMLRDGTNIRRLLPATDDKKDLAFRLLESMVPDGGTEHLPALRMALELGPDAIFFLTDADDLRESDLKAVLELNRDRARINVIQLGQGPQTESSNRLSELAKQSGGVFRYLETEQLGRSKNTDP